MEIIFNVFIIKDILFTFLTQQNYVNEAKIGI